MVVRARDDGDTARAADRMDRHVVPAHGAGAQRVDGAHRCQCSPRSFEGDAMPGRDVGERIGSDNGLATQIEQDEITLAKMRQMFSHARFRYGRIGSNFVDRWRTAQAGVEAQDTGQDMGGIGIKFAKAAVVVAGCENSLNRPPGCGRSHHHPVRNDGSCRGLIPCHAGLR